MLIVSDDPSVSDMFCRTLRLEGCDVWIAFSTTEGLLLAERHRPHVIVSDLRMPLASGFAFLRAIRRQPGLSHTPVALVTSDRCIAEEHVEAGRALGATVHFRPVWLSELVTIARELVHVAVAL